MRCNLVVQLQVFTNRDERRDAVPRGCAELLCRAATYVAGDEDAGHRRAEAASIVDEAALVQVDGATQEGCVRIQTDEDEGCTRCIRLGLSRAAVARHDGLELPCAAQLDNLGVSMHQEMRIAAHLVLQEA